MLVAQVAVLLQALVDDAFELLRNSNVQSAHSRRGVVQDRFHVGLLRDELLRQRVEIAESRDEIGRGAREGSRPLRETAVIFGAFIAYFVLKEKLTRRRLAATGAVMLGLVALKL